MLRQVTPPSTHFLYLNVCGVLYLEITLTVGAHLLSPNDTGGPHQRSLSLSLSLGRTLRVNANVC